MLAAPLTGKRLIAVLKFPKDIDDFIIFARAIHDSMLASPFFSSLGAKLATLSTNIGNLENMHTGLQTQPPTTTKAQRDAALLIVQNDLRTLKADVQTIADATPSSSESIITAADMKVKKQGAINKQDFTVKNSKVSGTVILTAKGADDKRTAHQWGISPDETDWTSLSLTIAPTLAAHTLATDLEKKHEYFFRHREILKDGPGAWSQTVSIVVT